VFFKGQEEKKYCSYLLDNVPCLGQQCFLISYSFYFNLTSFIYIYIYIYIYNSKIFGDGGHVFVARHGP